MSRLISCRHNLVQPTRRPLLKRESSSVFTTLDPANKAAGVTLSADNLTQTWGGSQGIGRSIVGLNRGTGKYAFEVTVSWAATTTPGFTLGVVTNEQALGTGNWLGQNLNSVGLANDGRVFHGGVSVSTGMGAMVSGDVYMVLVDLDANLITFLKTTGGVPNTTVFPTANISNIDRWSTRDNYGAIYAAGCIDNNTGSNNAALTFNFGATPFVNALPENYSIWPGA